MKNQDNDTYSLAHTRWKCQYHLVFTPKYHRKIIYGALRAETGKILRELCKRKEVEIIEAHAMHFTLDEKGVFVYAPPGERQNRIVELYAAFAFSALLNSFIFSNKTE